MGKLAGLFVLLAATASAEFTLEEKEVASQVTQFAVHGANVSFFVASEALQSTTPANHALYSDTLETCLDMGDEARKSAGYLVGSIAVNGEDLNDPAVRNARASFFWARVGTFLGECRGKVDEMIAQGAVTNDLTIYAIRILDHMAATHLDWGVKLDLLPFTEPHPPEWPFFVRRPPDMTVGLHGDFEAATAEEGTGLGYIWDSAQYLAVAWRDEPFVEGSEVHIRNFMLSLRDVTRRLHFVQMSHYHFIPCNAQVGSCADPESYAPTVNQFTRLNDTLEVALKEASSNVRSQQQFHLEPLRQMGYEMENVRGRHADGWFHAIDLWAWEAARFPCIDGFASRCQEDLDGTGPAPTPTPTPPPPVIVPCNLEVNSVLEIDGIAVGTINVPGNCP